MATQPRTKELCWKLIERLEKERDRLSERYHKLAGEFQVILLEKDKAFIDKCNKCREERAMK